MSVCTPDTVEQAVSHVLVSVDAAGNISCQPAELDVSGSNVLIVFALAARDWVFPDSGAIVVANGGTQFPIPAWTINNKQAALLDCDTAAGTFSYTVTVQHTSSGQRKSLDPTIKNQP
ncbi:hypothetical protein ACPOLB_21050 [Rubrivivax sp. RP6-9]|uniref:hypothetical protein n=1 Tax=Rubrivivax sp. RP6-9 TaxID=3415750 RepID=UPI003CC52E12